MVQIIIGDKEIKATRYGPDSYLVKNFVQTYLKKDPEAIMQDLQSNGQWVDRSAPEMKYRGKELKRTKLFLVESVEEMPRYRYPGATWRSLLNYHTISSMPNVSFFVEQMEEIKIDSQEVKINHVIGTLYKDGADNIGFHADKMKDIREGSYILDLSFGAVRDFHHRENDQDDSKYIIKLEPGSLFILGPETNSTMQHAVVETKELVGPRISLVMRDIKTIVPREEMMKKIGVSDRNKVRSAEKKKKRPDPPTSEEEEQPEKKQKRSEKDQK
eukprot:TRINITY_DN4604_c0_g1_i1.p1 TRINITY_DN4604_c0_g1~~TRINITY_DN4604_c0_g1_i1.p1  ORF type:complete len:272 (-),score=58.40 TRINITY_DN4604_c0_g1_i1:51-866(-)